MKKIYNTPVIKTRNIKPSQLICGSNVGVGEGSAENAQGNGWSLNSKSNCTGSDFEDVEDE